MNSSKHILSFFLLLFSLSALAQYKPDKLDKLWSEKKYYACYKQALKDSKKYKDQSAPILYQASSLLYLKNHKKIIKQKKNTVFTITDLLGKMRSKNPDGTHLKNFGTILHLLQDSLFNEGSRRYSYFLDYEPNGKPWRKDKDETRKQQLSQQYKKEAERIFLSLHKTFDNKTEAWKNWYGQELDYQVEGYLFPEYNNPIFRFCNTAKNESYLSSIEKELFYFTNLARTNPALFRSTFLKAEAPAVFTGGGTEYERSLSTDLAAMKPAPMLYPDSALWRAAEYHANDLGTTGNTGHESSDGTGCFDRIKKVSGKYANAENCSYGVNSSVGILMLLLIDEGISSKGHRYNQLGDSHTAGFAHRPHKGFGWGTVLDFR